MQLYVVRHGETEENVAGVVQGHNHGTLSPRGWQQAERLALRLRDIPFDALYSSDLGRAVQTAETIARYHKLPIIQNKLLRERGAGVFQGRPFREMVLAQEQSGRSQTEFKPESGENDPEVVARIMLFLESLNERPANHRVLIVSHGRWMRLLLAGALKLDLEQAFDLPQANTGVNILAYDPISGLAVETLNCTQHLASLPASL